MWVPYVNPQKLNMNIYGIVNYGYTNSVQCVTSQGYSQEFQKGFPKVKWISSRGLGAAPSDANESYMNVHML